MTDRETKRAYFQAAWEYNRAHDGSCRGPCRQCFDYRLDQVVRRGVEGVVAGAREIVARQDARTIEVGP